MRLVIPSRGRAHSIRKESLSVFPDAFVLVDERERANYAQVVREDRLLTHPGLPHLGHICNHILDTSPPDEPVAIAGDDHNAVVSIPGWTPRKLKPEQGEILLENAAQCARDAGCGLFGFGRNANPTMYEPMRPFRLAQWVTSPIGFVPGHGLRFDERLALMLDIDISLQSLVKHRIVWFDARFCFTGKALNNEGGNAHLRSQAAYAKERALLKEKWGRYIRFDTTAVHGSQAYRDGKPATTLMSYLSVPRTQPGY